ncbi:M48 family metalloprotease [Ramlibacter terrae]|uniref:M48 family metalloprotease n=1 Tax=Ramlibacter terrae TaxID=2732511 RepID=A0ABX6P402_9BURK|nr:M48 family metalloprotease [Ramlibacter terrae]
MLRKVFVMGVSLCQAVAAAASERDAGHSTLHDRCFSSTQRSSELGAADVPLADRLRNARVPLPPRFHDALARLKPFAHLPKGVKPELVGSHAVRSASVLSSGTIFVSSRLWRDEDALDREEAAAVIAHELAHTELSHVKDKLCEAVALSGDESLSLNAAAGAAHRAIRAGDDQLAVRMMQGNHQRELQADRRAAELLRLAGLPDAALPRMLVKLAQGDGGGHSGTHPALETRLEKPGVRVAR